MAKDLLQRASTVLERGGSRAWWLVFGGALAVYLLTAHYMLGSIDTQAAGWPAWQLVHHGNVFVEGLRPRMFWSVPAGHHLVSDRTPGPILVTVPVTALLYLLGPSFVPGAITAALLTAAAVATLFLTFRLLVPMHRALASTVVVAVGTGLWSVASTEVWMHSVDALCLAAAAYALARSRLVVAGAWLALGITTRPQLAVIAAVVGVMTAWQQRGWRPLVAVGVPAVGGLAFLVAWNHAVFGHFSVTGGYGAYPMVNLTRVGASASGTGGQTGMVAAVHGYLLNLAGFLLSPQRGVLVVTPLALLLVLGARPAWRSAPPWVRAVALGGAAYALVQMRINSFTGGDAFYGYRLAIELVVCAAPLAVVAQHVWVTQHASVWRAARVLAVISVTVQAIGAFCFELRTSSASDPWRTSSLLDALRSHPIGGLLIVAVAVPVAALLWDSVTAGGRRASRTHLRASQPPACP